ncbi:MAG TPA: PilZ domain-containing protein [Acidimicrobiia bacterium]|jgi:c-di-GMP-binding flagellar brake protein YcgR
MAAPELLVGQVAVVALVSGDHELDRVRGRVERVVDRSLTVRVPEGEHVPREFDTGVAVTVTYQERIALYTFPGRVSLWEETCLLVERTGDAEEVQRRQYVRLSEPVPVECLTVDDVTGKLFSLDATTMNVSGGGLAIETNRQSAPNTRVVVVLRPEGQPPILAITTVVASELVAPAAKRVTTRLTFAAIAEADRERLIRYVFENLR